jgi:hypothetical protein
MQFACAAAAAPLHPLVARTSPWIPLQSFCKVQAVALPGRRQGPLHLLCAKSSRALRGRRQGAAAPLATPAGALPLDPDLMHVYTECLISMLTGRSEQATTDACWWHTVSMCRCVHSEITSFAGGLGAARHPSGEREGRSPLACAQRTGCEIEGSARGGARSHIRNANAASQRGARGAAPARSRHIARPMAAATCDVRRATCSIISF